MWREVPEARQGGVGHDPSRWGEAERDLSPVLERIPAGEKAETQNLLKPSFLSPPLRGPLGTAGPPFSH